MDDLLQVIVSSIWKPWIIVFHFGMSHTFLTNLRMVDIAQVQCAPKNCMFEQIAVKLSGNMEGSTSLPVGLTCSHPHFREIESAG